MSSKSSTNYNYIDNKGNRVLVYPAINPEIISYIAKVQGEKEKIDNPTNFQSQNPKLINIKKKPISFDYYSAEKKHSSNNAIMNENMNFDKAKRTQAKKGLLYLLNNLSIGTFCPEINTYFEEMKELKLNEMKNAYKQQQQMKNKAKNNENKKTPFSSSPAKGGYSHLLNQQNKTDLIDDTGNPMNKENQYLLSFKKRPKENIENPFKDIQMFKDFKSDFTPQEIAEIYNVEDISKAGVKFKYTKEKEAKLKLIHSENKKMKNLNKSLSNEKNDENDKKFSIINAINNAEVNSDEES